jgi:hypothetical protein
VQGERDRQALQFQDTPKLVVEKKGFRLIQCLDKECEDAIAALATFRGIEPVSFDRLLIWQMDRLIAQKELAVEAVLRADRVGPPVGSGRGRRAGVGRGTGRTCAGSRGRRRSSCCPGSARRRPGRGWWCTWG